LLAKPAIAIRYRQEFIIFLYPDIFRRKNDILFPLRPILHEIVYNIKGHVGSKSPEERKRFDDEADALADELIDSLYTCRNGDQ
jgi:predicted metal-dependent peptidase